MSILIKGMEMPKSCRKCFIKQGSCPAIRKRIQVLPTNSDIWVPYNYRHDDCPLWGVPTPHGRLIDADALIEDLERQCKEVFRVDAVSPDDYWITRNEAYNEALWKTWVESFGDYLKTRPTILEAEE